MSNLHRSLANAQLCPRVLLSVLYLKNMPLSKPYIPCVILHLYNVSGSYLETTAERSRGLLSTVSELFAMGVARGAHGLSN